MNRALHIPKPQEQPIPRNQVQQRLSRLLASLLASIHLLEHAGPVRGNLGGSVVAKPNTAHHATPHMVNNKTFVRASSGCRWGCRRRGRPLVQERAQQRLGVPASLLPRRARLIIHRRPQQQQARDPARRQERHARDDPSALAGAEGVRLGDAQAVHDLQGHDGTVPVGEVVHSLTAGGPVAQRLDRDKVGRRGESLVRELGLVQGDGHAHAVEQDDGRLGGVDVAVARDGVPGSDAAQVGNGDCVAGSHDKATDSLGRLML